VSIALTACMNSAMSWAKATDSPGSALAAGTPASQVCTDQGPGYPKPGSPIAIGSGVAKRVLPRSSRAAAASNSSTRLVSAGSVTRNGKRAQSLGPIRKIE
jgi:hypothetical protein